jgi:hypothetical protein
MQRLGMRSLKFCLATGFVASLSSARNVDAEPSAPLGTVIFEVDRFVDGHWVLDTPRDSFLLGDCTGCERRVTFGYSQMNGLPDDLRLLGGGSIGVTFYGFSRDELTASITTGSSLVRAAGEAAVGITVEATSLALRPGQPIILRYAVESANPFDAEPVGPGVDTKQELYRATVSVEP